MTIASPNADTAGNLSGEIKVEEAANTPNWWIDEGIPGIGDKPQWLGDKFKTAADLAKSYHELEKRVGTAPDSYDFSTSKYLDADYAPFQELQDLAKSRKVPKDVMDKVVDSMDRYFNEFATDEKEEIRKLGDNAQERLQTLNNWAKANLSEDSYYALTSNLRNAESVRALEELRSKFMTASSQIPNGNDPSTTTGLTMKEVQEEMTANLEKYKTDPKYRAEMMRKIEAVSKNSGFIDKIY